MRLALAVGMLSLAACTDDNTSDNETETESEEIVYDDVAIDMDVEARFGDQPFACDEEIRYVGGASFFVQDFQVLIRDIGLVAIDGSVTPLTLEESANQANNMILLDYATDERYCLGDADTYHRIVGSAPGGAYTALQFTIGADEVVNHTLPEEVPAPLIDARTYRGSYLWGYYHFNLLMDVAGKGPWNFSMGAVGCSVDGVGASCTAENNLTIEIPFEDFENQHLVFDIGALLDLMQVGIDSGGDPGCMSAKADPECQSAYQAYGLGAREQVWAFAE